MHPCKNYINFKCNKSDRLVCISSNKDDVEEWCKKFEKREETLEEYLNILGDEFAKKYDDLLRGSSSKESSLQTWERGMAWGRYTAIIWNKREILRKAKLNNEGIS